MKPTLFAFLVIACLLLLVPHAEAAELNDTAFGFRLEVPDGFTSLPLDPSEEDTIYKFVDGEPSPDHPARVIQIQRLRGVIAPDVRMKESELPAVEGVTTTLQDFIWKGHEMDAIRQKLPLPTGSAYVVFGIQYPLDGEGVQLQVGGPADEEPEVFRLFQQLAGKFENTRPLYSPAVPAVRELSKEERVGKVAGGIIKLAVAALILLLLLAAAKRAFSKGSKNV